MSGSGCGADPPRVSVVVPTHNHGAFIGEALASVVAQSCTEIEIIVVDDGSTDATRAVLAPWRARGVQVIEQPCSGPAAARNRGLLQARGEFVALLDADDLWPRTDMVEAAVRALDADADAGWTFGDAQPFEREGGAVSFLGPPYLASAGRYTQRSMRERRLPLGVADLCSDDRFFIPTGTLLIRRCCLDEVGLFDPQLRMFEDTDLWLRMLRYPVLFFPEVLLWRRVHRRNLSHRRWEHLESLKVLFERHRLEAAGVSYDFHAARAYYHAGRESWQQHDYGAAARAFRQSLAHRPAWKAGALFAASALAARLGRGGPRVD